MTPDHFKGILTAAVAGDHDALEEILHLYEPLILKYSYVDSDLDEDLQQYLMIHIALTISKFPL